MNFSAVLWWCGLALITLSCAMVLPVISMATIDESSFLAPFTISLIAGSFLGLSLILIARQKSGAGSAKAGIREVVLLLLMWWLVTPFFAGLPLFLSGESLGNAWYESVSAMTTTSAWLSRSDAVAVYSLMLWRAELQWLGGLVSLAAAAAVFVRPEFIGISNVTTPFSTGQDESYLWAFRSALSKFLPYYASISAVVGILLFLFGVPADEAVILSLTLPASGGFIPDSSTLTDRPAAQLVTFVAIALSAVSFISVVNALRFSGSKIRNKIDVETPAFLVCVLAVAVIFLLTSLNPTLNALPGQVFNAASVISTNGVLLGDRPALIPVLVTTVIGGAAVSTAGGLKLIRWIATFSRAKQEVWKLIHPRGVYGSETTANELAIWIHYIAFTIILAFFILGISSFGHSLELSATAAVAVVSNAGPLLGLVSEQADYSQFEPSLRIMLALGMIIGRLEMVIALALFNNYFWRA